jgi:quercetin dioxygenase-like cupin family protein
MDAQKKLKMMDIEPSVLNLTGSIDYQQGSIVSKQLIKKDTGNVTFFAFDQGEGLSEHIAPYDAMVYVVEGEAEITIAKKPYNVKSGEMIVMPANQPHALKALQKFKMLLVMIRS